MKFTKIVIEIIMFLLMMFLIFEIDNNPKKDNVLVASMIIMIVVLFIESIFIRYYSSKIYTSFLKLESVKDKMEDRYQKYIRDISSEFLYPTIDRDDFVKILIDNNQKILSKYKEKGEKDGF